MTEAIITLEIENLWELEDFISLNEKVFSYAKMKLEDYGDSNID